jgi:hypothetical protein
LRKIPAGGGEPTELYASGFPEKGEAILAGWSGEGHFLLFWQGDILSASLLADGVPLYVVSARGGTPVPLAGAVLVHSDFIATQPAGGEWGEAAPRLVADELGPLPGPASGWFGYYGHVEWDSLFDWWPEVTPTVLPVTGNALPESLLLIIAGVLALVAGWGLRLRLRKLRLSSHAGE